MSSRRLDRFRVVLVGSKIPGNIGSVARLLENFAVGEGALVDPQCEWRTGEAQWRATGSSKERLNSLPVHSSLGDAIRDCQYSVGFTARAGKTRKATLKLEDLSRMLPGRVALVFGREDLCLSSEEAGICSHLCALDASEDFPALNLSHSVAVVLSRLFQNERDSRRGHTETATRGELEPLFAHLREMLIHLGYEGEGNPERVLLKLEKIYSRAGIRRDEIPLLRGIITKTLQRSGS